MKPSALILALLIAFLSIKPTVEVFAGQVSLTHTETLSNSCSDEQACNEMSCSATESCLDTEPCNETDSCPPQTKGPENTCTNDNCSSLCSPLTSCCLVLNYCYKGDLLALPIPKSINNTPYINLKTALASTARPEFWQPPKI